MKAPLIRRFCAFAIDYSIVGVACWLFVFVVGTPTHEGFLEYRVEWPLGLVVPLIWFSLLAVPESISGITAGKKILGLRVLKKDGSRLGFMAAALRRVCDVVDFWMSCCLVAFFARHETKFGQRVGDLVSGAVVLVTHEQRANQTAQTAATAQRGQPSVFGRFT